VDVASFRSVLTAAADTALDKLVVPGYSALGPAVRRLWWAPDAAELVGRPEVLVTGAGSGLGLATATGLARLGARVHLVGRSTERLEQAVTAVRARVPGAALVVRPCDVSDLDAVADLVTALSDDVVALHALVHCAGLIPQRRTTSAQGHELAFATHVLGPYALTVGLRDLLAADGDGRVVWVSSGGMYPVPAVTRDLEYTSGEYKGVTAYARTKRMQVAVAEHLAATFSRPGDPVVHAMHPGWADTPGVSGSIPGFAAVTAAVLRTAEQGADTIVWLAAAAEPARTTGLFWHDRRPRPTQYLPLLHDDPVARVRLFETCAQVSRARASR
jgi:dehydrogenase/reductase SDR family protein 12